MEKVILGLGSNVGDKMTYLKNAVKALSLLLDNIVTSSVYQTGAQEYTLQDDFLNMVVAGEYAGEPYTLLDKLQKIERENGRMRSSEVRKGPRTLDIDILFFGKRTVSTPVLTLPHPAIRNRAFVLVPLVELLPGIKDLDGSLYKDLLPSLKGQKVEIIGRLE